MKFVDRRSISGLHQHTIPCVFLTHASSTIRSLGVMVQAGCRTSLQYEFLFTSDKNAPANALLYIASYGLYTSNMAGNRVKLTNFDSRGLNIKISCFIWSDWRKNTQNGSLCIRNLSEVCWSVWDFTITIIPSSGFSEEMGRIPRNLHPLPVFDKYQKGSALSGVQNCLTKSDQGNW